MSLVTVTKISLSFSGKQVFREASFQVEPGQRVALIGPNGSGKTTLLRLLMGEVHPDEGEVRIAKGAQLGYLPQDIQEGLHGRLLDSVIHSVPDRAPLKETMRRTVKELERTTSEKRQIQLAQRLSEIHLELERIEAAYPPHMAEKILLGLGFHPNDFHRPLSELSGGWKMRAAMAALLFRKPDLLLLDEPTNHLDIPSVRWLEQFLRELKGAIILVSHDRDFLNRQTSRTISLEPEGMRLYGGNYDFYVKAREEETKTLEARARNQEQRIREARRFIDRFRAKASKARQAQSKIKLVKKVQLVEAHRREKTIHFSFPEVPRSGRRVASLRGISKRFGPKRIYENLELNIFRGERIAVIGPNGCGKTTLLRMLAGELQPDQGEITLGPGVIMSYFAQHHSEMLDPAKTILQEVHQVVSSESIGFVRGLCGAFLFSGDDVEKTIEVLSGGERARVSLAKLLAAPGNFMIMDEPTNHLDINSSEKLTEALQGYQGTLLFVSHNQSFVNRLVTRIWDIRETGVSDYPGNLDEYYDHLMRVEEKLPAGEKMDSDGPADGPRVKAQDREGRHGAGVDRKARKRERALRRRFIQETLQPVISELDRIEERIAALEKKQKEMEKRLADPEVFKDKEAYVSLTLAYRQVKSELDPLLLQWEERQLHLEALKKALDM